MSIGILKRILTELGHFQDLKLRRTAFQCSTAFII